MLGFSFDGFWEELMGSFGSRSLEALFVEESQIMLCEGEYMTPKGSGRGNIALYPDSVCILPQTAGAVRIPLAFVANMTLNGYQLQMTMSSGTVYGVGKRGYDTKPFADRVFDAADLVYRQRSQALAKVPVTAPYTEKGLFRTNDQDLYWNAAFGRGCCALELFTGEDSATYLYRFAEPAGLFLKMLCEATEAVGVHREIIYLSDEELAKRPLYRMTAFRSEAVRFLRARSAGRIIHSSSHDARLKEFLES